MFPLIKYRRTFGKWLDGEKELDEKRQDLTYLFEVLSWKCIFSQPYVGWIKMKIYIAQQILPVHGIICLSDTENKFIVWNYCFSGPTNIYLFEFSNINNRIKCKICSKLTIEAPDVSLWIYLTHYSSVFFATLNMEIADGILYCFNLNLSMHFRVGSRSLDLRWSSM